MHPELSDIHLRRAMDPYTWARWRDSFYECSCIIPAPTDPFPRHHTIPYMVKESVLDTAAAPTPPPTPVSETPSIPTDIIVEPALPSDVAAIVEIGSKGFPIPLRDHFSREDIAGYVRKTYNESNILKELSDPSRSILVAREATESGRVLGICQLIRNEPKPKSSLDASGSSRLASSSTSLSRAFLSPSPSTSPSSSPQSPPPARKWASLHKLYINPDIRGRGIGSKLVAAIEKMAMDEGFDRIWLICYHRNDAAQRLYSKLGWSRCGEIALPLGAAGVREFVYEKDLSSEDDHLRS